MTTQLVDPLVGGIHAGDTTRMSTAAVFPALLDAASSGSIMRALRMTTPSPPASAPGSPTTGDGEAPVFYTVRDGLSRLVDRLADALGTRGVDIRMRTPVERWSSVGPTTERGGMRTRRRAGHCAPPGAPWKPTPS